MKNPLDRTHLEQLNQAAADLVAAETLTRKCTACGIDVEPIEQDRQELLDRVKRMRKEFFDGEGSPLILPEKPDYGA